MYTYICSWSWCPGGTAYVQGRGEGVRSDIQIVIVYLFHLIDEVLAACRKIELGISRNFQLL